ncbi:dioscorin DB3S [Oryza sativa Japonica Group]|uniref:Carbonic anhydrase n=2 Tax=Oryza sativa subsp. japonica TaxID=39947 RepID=Q6YZ83_ORYSJ|nr:alpha carbonic anhydrase 7 [Oryza sativa Japonica Group]KAB8108548.1 hypothetical protein EE612_044337 [Oryza sativa]KAF2919716.1 hypothetical protein DAI22_08g156600 [Oryza sativa Japonica Group]BAC24976.1 putative dioscorin [Oryza sativa Japonica Group]BAC99796.1 putative dioscorin [Oryza sativa Japonica Group]BAF23745.1 Os08g0423500 [Oryza sativa Japonica Group]|eukprot:NP_001061831.1 Os08g0423500 [Oryza sativa Japonica Group]
MSTSARRLLLLAGAAAAIALLLSATAPVAGAEDDGYSYIPGSPRGPQNWGSLKPEWATCSSGKMQSPINLGLLDLTLAPGLGNLNYTYQNANASVVNRGHDIMVRFDGDAGSLKINGTAYQLRQMHWHTPSEHTIDGRRYDMELHMVHLNAQNQAAVIGILYTIGTRDEFLQKLEPYIIEISKQEGKERVIIGGADPNVAKGQDTVYYRYMGSFTTPPCTEGVIWTVVRKVRTVSLSQITLLKAAVLTGNENNARPLQGVNNREIDLFLPLPLINN